MITILEGCGGSASRPGRSLPPGKTRYPLYRRLGGSQGRSGLVRKIRFHPVFDPRTVQAVASRYTGYTTRPTCRFKANVKVIWGHEKMFWIQGQAFLQMNSSLMISEILTTTRINVTVNWGFYREDGGSRFSQNVVIYTSLCLVKAPNRVVWNV
jgi:hypothetical protein